MAKMAAVRQAQEKRRQRQMEIEAARKVNVSLSCCTAMDGISVAGKHGAPPSIVVYLANPIR